LRCGPDPWITRGRRACTPVRADGSQSPPAAPQRPGHPRLPRGRPV